MRTVLLIFIPNVSFPPTKSGHLTKIEHDFFVELILIQNKLSPNFEKDLIEHISNCTAW